MVSKSYQLGFLNVAVAVVVAGIIIAMAIIYSSPRKADVPAPPAPSSGLKASAVDNIKPVNGGDHILGNPKAAVQVVEFSDLECPFCKKFHFTMKQIIEGYNGEVAWVYRHFPLDQLHSKARKEAEATECADELGGNEAFWRYLDRLFEVTPSNNGLDPTELPRIAEYIGLDRLQFENCLNSSKYAARVEADYQDGVASGGRGTPYSIVVTSDGAQEVISGAQPYQMVKQTIDAILNRN